VGPVKLVMTGSPPSAGAGVAASLGLGLASPSLTVRRLKSMYSQLVAVLPYTRKPSGLSPATRVTSCFQDQGPSGVTVAPA
jgi:hypothetical protein